MKDKKKTRDYTVLMPQFWRQTLYVNAESLEEARSLAKQGKGHLGVLTHVSNTLPSDWDIEETK